MRYRLAELERPLMGELRGPDAVATGACVDTRALAEGDLFFALRGVRDGVDFVPEAFSRGASGAVVPVYFKGTERPIIIVEDTLTALVRLAFFHRNRIDSRVIAITGSSGKTCVKDMIALLLGTKFSVSASPQSFNNHIGVPLSILASNCEDFLVLEIGTNHPGEIRPLGGLARPHFAVITSIGRSHLEAFGNTHGVAREKSELLSCLERNGITFLPERLLHEDIILSAVRPDVRVIRYQAEDIEVNGSGASFTFRGEKFRVPVPHPGYAQNAACAIAVALEMGIEPDAARKALLSFVPTGMRMKTERIGEIDVINDAYNSNPDTAEAFVLSLSQPERTILVLGDMLELGPDSPRFHRELGEIAAKRNFKKIICVGDLSRNTADSSGGIWFPGPDEAAKYLSQTLKPGDKLALKASRLMRLERILEVLRDVL
ncbi:MAG: UDP-N-acetylmuramoyl-tripeptide--D-alanyl-D-alanine ligase [candidate division WOR-3 bacterium]